MTDQTASPAQAPAAPIQEPVTHGLQMKRRNPWAVWLLSLVTLGIYGLVWWYKIHAEMARYDPRQRIEPVVSFLAMFLGPLIIIPPFWSAAAEGGRISRAQETAGLRATCSGALGLLLYILFFTIAIYYQSELNQIIDSYREDNGEVMDEGSRVPLHS